MYEGLHAPPNGLRKTRVAGSPADKADLEVADEILEINGESLANSTHTDVISHIHNVSWPKL